MSEPQFIKTKEDGLVRDINSKALLNTNKTALERNRTLRAAHHRRETEINDLRNVCHHLERRIEELATIVTQANSFIKV
jgi:hypothetical protein